MSRIVWIFSLVVILCLAGCASEKTGEKRTRGAAVAEDPGATKVTAIKDAKPEPRPEAGAARERSATAVDDLPLTCPTVLVSGRVTLHDGKPLTSGTMQLKAAQRDEENRVKVVVQAVASLDEDGRYQLRGMDEQFVQWELQSDYPAMTGSLERNQDFETSKSVLRRVTNDVQLPEFHKVTGQVVNEKNEPVGGASISAIQGMGGSRAMSLSTTSTAEGTFELAAVGASPEGVWLGASVDGYVPVSKQVAVPTTETIVLKFEARGGTVNGVVYFRDTMNPVAGVQLGIAPQDHRTPGARLFMKPLVTDTEGRFTWKNVPPNSGMQIFNISGVSDDRKVGLSLPAPGPIKVQEGETTDVVVYAYEGHTVMGMVYDRDTSEPLSGAKVSLGWQWDEKSHVETDAFGQYRLTGVFPQGGSARQQLQVKLPGYKLHSDEWYQRGGSVMLPEDNLVAIADLAMVQTVKISGVVENAEGVPVPGATIRTYSSLDTSMIHSREALPKTGADGKFEVEVAPFSQNRLYAEARGYPEVGSDVVPVMTEDVTGVKVVLEPGATVGGVVLLPDGKPAAGAGVYMERRYSVDGNSTSLRNDQAGTADKEGKFLLKDVGRNAQIYAQLEGYARSATKVVETEPAQIVTGTELQLSENMTISGVVVDVDKKPLQGVNVQAYGVGVYEHVQTDAKGEFTIKKLAEGEYSVYSNVEGYSTKGNSNLRVKAGTAGLEIVMEESGTLKLVGTVVEKGTGKALEDFTITALHGDFKKSEEPGQFIGEKLQNRMQYEITLTAPGYEKREERLVFMDDTGTVERKFELGREGAITGRVLTKGSRDPLAGVAVMNYGSMESYELTSAAPKKHSLTDEEGRFTLAPVPTGRNQVKFAPKAPLAEVWRTAQVKDGEVLDLGDIEVSAGGAIHGKVVRQGGKEPAAGVNVSIMANQGVEIQIRKRAITNAQGEFKFEGLPPVRFQVQVNHQSKAVTVPEDGVVEVEFEEGGVTMSGTVTRGGEPASASMSATGPEGARVSTYANGGKYSLSGLKPGKYEFMLGSSYFPHRETVDVPDEPEFEKNFELPDGGINVTVVNSDGEPVAGAAVSISRASSGAGFDQSWVNQSSTEQTNGSGVAEFTGLTPGTFSVSARKDGAGSARQTGVQMKNGETAEVELRLSTDGGTLVSVALNYATGNAVQEAWCYLTDESGRFNHAGKRDASGVMTIENIPPGVYRTNVSYWSFSQAERQVEIKAGETARIEDVLYPAGAVHWTLRKKDGSAAEGVSVRVVPQNTDPVESEKSGVTNHEGLFVQRGLAPGTYQLTATMEGKGSVTETVTVAAGDNTMRETVASGW